MPDAAPLRLGGSFTITAWVAPTRPGVVGWVGEPGAQGVVTKWAADRGYGLMIDEQGRLALWLGGADGEVARVAAEPALRRWAPAIPGAGRPRPHGVPTQWYFVAATFDADTGGVALYQEPLDLYANDPTRVVVEQTTPVRALATPDVSLHMAAYATADGGVAGHYNGKIDNPRLYARALSRAEVEAIAAGAGPADAVAAWDFAADIESDRVRDTAGSGLDGRTVNMPTRAVTGPPVGRHRDGLPEGARAVRRHPLPRQRPAGRGVGRRLRLRGAGGPAERRVRGAAADHHERGLRAVLRPPRRAGRPPRTSRSSPRPSATSPTPGPAAPASSR